MRFPFSALAFACLAALHPARSAQIGDLPGEDVSSGELEKSLEKVDLGGRQEKRSNYWLAPPVEEQLSRDRTLIPMGKGALFVPTFTEPRREPEVTVLNAKGRLLKSGQTGERILLDSGTYSIRFGSGTSSQQIPVKVTIDEGH